MVQQDVAFREFQTELGWMALAVTDRGVARVLFGYPSRSACRVALEDAWQQRPKRVVRKSSDDQELSSDARESLADCVQQQLSDYAGGGDELADSVPLDLSCRTEFQRRVMLACRKVVYGQTASYLELAQRVHSPRAARAVGAVMACNPLPLLVPCHRIVAAQGLIGGFSAPDGLRMKRRLLAMEKAGSATAVS